MEAAGLGIGVIGLVGQLLSASFKGYEFLGRVQTIGGDLGRFQWRVKDEGLRLKRWEEAWNRRHEGAAVVDGEVEQHVIATLARLVDTFRDLDSLRVRYDLAPSPSPGTTASASAPTPPPSTKKSSSFRRLFSLRRRPAGISAPTSSSNSSTHSTTPPPSHPVDLAKLSIASSTMDTELAALHQAARDIETSLGAVMKLRWAMADQEKADQLVMDLSMYNGALERYVTPLGPQKVATTVVVKPPAPKPKCFSVPFPRNDNFTGREAAIAEVHQKLSDPQRETNRIAVYGMGGVGKTQLINEYAHRYRSSYSHVFWLHGSRSSTLHSSFATISRLGGLKTDIEGDQQAVAIRKAREWLESAESGRWLLIVDIGDDIFASSQRGTQVHSGGIYKQLHQLLPVRGAVVTMTRDKKIVGSRIARDGLELDTFDEDEAMMLFKEVAFGNDYFPSPSEERDIAEVCRNLGYLPLAIDQAASFLRVSGMRLGDFLTRNAELRHDPALDEMVDELPSDYSTTVLKTWEMSLAYLDMHFRSASLLFQLLSFMDNEFIDEQILTTGLFREWDPAVDESVVLSYPYPPESVLSKLGTPGFENEDHLTSGIKALDDLSLLQRNTATGVVWVHDLVHQWLRLRMASTERQSWSIAAIDTIGHASDFHLVSRGHGEAPFLFFLRYHQDIDFTASPMTLDQRTFRKLLEASDIFLTSKELKKSLLQTTSRILLNARDKTALSDGTHLTNLWTFLVALPLYIQDHCPHLSNPASFAWEAYLSLLTRTIPHLAIPTTHTPLLLTPRMLEHFIYFFTILDLEDPALAVLLQFTHHLYSTLSMHPLPEQSLLIATGTLESITGRLCHEQGEAMLSAVLLNRGITHLHDAGYPVTDSAIREYAGQLAPILTSLGRPEASRGLLLRSAQAVQASPAASKKPVVVDWVNKDPYSLPVATLEALVKTYNGQPQALGLLAVMCIRAARIHRKHFPGRRSVGYGDSGMKLADEIMKGKNVDLGFAAALYWYRLMDYEEDVGLFREKASDPDESAPPPGRLLTWKAWRHCGVKLGECLTTRNITPQSQVREFVNAVERLYSLTIADGSRGHWIGEEASADRSKAMDVLTGLPGFIADRYDVGSMDQKLQEMAEGAERWMQEGTNVETTEDIAFWAGLEDEMWEHPAFSHLDDDTDPDELQQELEKTVDELCGKL